MNIDPSVRSLLLEVMRTFPDSASRMKARARELRSVRYSTTEMLEEFARETQRAIGRGDQSLARAHLSFMSAFLRHADPKQREYIDVYYVESLIPGMPKANQREAWELMPQNLRELHIQVWGAPLFKQR